MSAQVRIYGASDDLIEVEGAIVEEFNDVDFGEGAYVYVSTGDVFRFRLEDEGWRCTVVVSATAPSVGREGDDADDVATVAGRVVWVVATTVAPVVAESDL